LARAIKEKVSALSISSHIASSAITDNNNLWSIAQLDPCYEASDVVNIPSLCSVLLPVSPRFFYYGL